MKHCMKCFVSKFSSRFKKIFSDNYNSNIILNYCFKGLSISLGLISTKMILGHLGATVYGTWVTITSVVSWLNSGDLGIGNGLRNELAKAYSDGDKGRELQLIVIAFSSMIKIACVLFLGFILLSEIFFMTNILSSEIRLAIYITSAFFCLNLFLGTSQSVALGYQKSWMTTLTISEIQFFLILSILIIEKFGIVSDLNNFAVINGICSTVPNLILILLLKKTGIEITFSKNISGNSSLSKAIKSTGINFFLIQICGVILYSTDNLIINIIAGSDMVAKYDVINKIYNTGNTLFSVSLIALWSAVTFYAAQNNIAWIRNRIKQLLVFWTIYSFGVVLVSFFFNPIVKIWLGNKAIEYECSIIVLFGVYSSMTAFSAIFVNILNGLGEVKIQLVLAVVSAILNIPLSIVFANDFDMGIFGVKFATFLSALIVAIIMPIEVWVKLKRMEKDIKQYEDCDSY